LPQSILFQWEEDKKEASQSQLSYESEYICLRGQEWNLNNVTSHDTAGAVELSRFSVDEKTEEEECFRARKCRRLVTLHFHALL
jgi:hypothetical protein